MANNRPFRYRLNRDEYDFIWKHSQKTNIPPEVYRGFLFDIFWNLYLHKILKWETISFANVFTLVPYKTRIRKFINYKVKFKANTKGKKNFIRDLKKQLRPDIVLTVDGGTTNGQSISKNS